MSAVGLVDLVRSQCISECSSAYDPSITDYGCPRQSLSQCMYVGVLRKCLYLFIHLETLAFHDSDRKFRIACIYMNARIN